MLHQVFYCKVWAIIEPLVNLNPEAVRNYVDAGNLAGYAEGVRDFRNPMLIGSTDEATTIYADVHPDDEQTKRRELLGTRVSELLGFMGLETEVRQPQA